MVERSAERWGGGGGAGGFGEANVVDSAELLTKFDWLQS